MKEKDPHQGKVALLGSGGLSATMKAEIREQLRNAKPKQDREEVHWCCLTCNAKLLKKGSDWVFMPSPETESQEELWGELENYLVVYRDKFTPTVTDEGKKLFSIQRNKQ